MFGRWRKRRKVEAEAEFLTMVAMLWARGDFEARWIAWTLFISEGSKELGSGPMGDIRRFTEGTKISKGLTSLGYPESSKSFSMCLVAGTFSWGINDDDKGDPRNVRQLSIEKIMGEKAPPYRVAFHRFQRSLS
ncbi:MAG: hypothetical protein RH982_17785 [Parvibaculum sp.]